MQSGQIASLAGLFGRDSWVIWPICYFDFWGRKLMLWASKLPRQQWRLFCTHLFRLTPFRARFWTLWLRSGLNEFNIFLISSQLDFLLPCTRSCINIVYYERTYIFSLRRRTYNLWVMESHFLTNAQEHFFLALAKLSRSVILNNFVNKFVTANQKIAEIALITAKPNRKWLHTVKICLQPKQ